MVDAPDPSRRSFLLGRFNDVPQAAEATIAVIGQSCFAFRGVACMSCRDACSSGAVRFELAIGGARPRIDAQTCTGCGDCSSACPAHAISLSAVQEMS